MGKRDPYLFTRALARKKKKKRKNSPKKSLSIDHHKFRFAIIYDVTTQTLGSGFSGLVQFAIHPNSLSRHYQFNPNTQASFLSLGAEATAIQTYYEMYKTTFTKVTYTPRATEFEAGTFGSDGIVPANQPIYISYDIDAPSVANNADTLILKTKTRTRNMARKWSVTQKIPKTNQVTSAINTAILPGGWRDVDLDGNDASTLGALQFSTRFPYTYIDEVGQVTNVADGFVLGSILVETYVEFKKRR